MGEVLYDNSAQTFMPRIVDAGDLERANGRLYSAEIVANQFLGPPLAGLLLAVGFALPFVLDAGTFAVSAGAGLRHRRHAARPGRRGAGVERRPWRAEMAEGFRWLWHHDLLRTLAITLGLLNLLSSVSGAAVRALRPGGPRHRRRPSSPCSSTAAAVGGVRRRLDGVGASPSASARRRRSAPALWGGARVSLGIGLVVGVAARRRAAVRVESFIAVLWNVITVSLRQTIIPDRLLGRVNSVYRFFGWGMIPIGALIGGVVVAVARRAAVAGDALRVPWIVAGVGPARSSPPCVGRTAHVGTASTAARAGRQRRRTRVRSTRRAR